MKQKNTKMKRVLSFALALMMSAGVSLTSANAAEDTIKVPASNLPTTSLQNVAANKYAWASSYEAMGGWSARVAQGQAGEHLSFFPACAVDNQIGAEFGWKSETAAAGIADNDANPWIAVDLGKAYRMEFIDIYMDPSMGDRNIVIEVANEREDNPTEYFYTGTPVSAETFDHGALINPVKVYEGAPAYFGHDKARIKIDNVEKYRYLKISRPAGNAAQLMIKEIMVYAQDKDNLMNLSKGKPMIINDGPYGLQAENRETAMLTNGVIEYDTAAQVYPSADYGRISIDLGKEYKVERIDIVSTRGVYWIGNAETHHRGAYDIYGGTQIGQSTEEGDPYGEYYPHVVGRMYPGLMPGAAKIVSQPEYTGPTGSTISHVIDAEPMRYITFRKTSGINFNCSEIIVWGYEVPEEETEVELIQVNPTITTAKYEPTMPYYPFNSKEHYKIERIEVTGTEENLKNFEIYAEAPAYYPVHDNERKIRIAEQGEVEPGTTKLVFDTSAYNVMANAISISRKSGNTTSDLFANVVKIYARKDLAMAEVAKGRPVTGTNANGAITDGSLDSIAEHYAGNGGVVITLDKALPVCSVDIERRYAYSDMGNSNAYYDVLGSNDNESFELLASTARQGVAPHGRNTITFNNDKAYKYIKVLPKAGEFIGTVENYMGLGGTGTTTGYDVIAEIRVYAPQSAFDMAANAADFKFTASADGSGDATTSLAGDYIGVSFTLQNTGERALSGVYSVLALYNADGSLAKVKLTPIETVAIGGSANVAYGVENPLAANPTGAKAAHFIWTMDDLTPVAGGKADMTHTEPGAASVIYASADGSGTGSAASPASLASAMQKAGQIKSATDKDVTVMLAEGDYFFTSL